MDQPHYLHLEILGIQLIHIEWGRLQPSEDYRDLQYPMTIGFQPPDDTQPQAHR